MAIDIEEGIPATITAGDAVSFLIRNPDFPAPTWSSVIKFKDAAGALISFNGAASGTNHLFELSNANTATLVAGENLVCLQFSDGTHRETTDWTPVNILSDPASASTATFAEAQVTRLRTVIAALATANASGMKSINFNGQSIEYDSFAEYQNQLPYWEARVIREKKIARAQRGIPNHRTVGPQFIRDDMNIPSRTLPFP